MAFIFGRRTLLLLPVIVLSVRGTLRQAISVDTNGPASIDVSSNTISSINENDCCYEAAIRITGEANTENSWTINNNDIASSDNKYPWQSGIFISGERTPRQVSFSISGNTINNARSYGIRLEESYF